MAGAIAGTAILKIKGVQDKLDTITLTINNECNMQCRHCYLQYVSSKRIIDDSVLESIFESEFRHLVVVGKEPLVNRDSINKVCEIVELCRKAGHSVSFVTNGLNLSLLPSEIIPQIDYIDVSFDGGALSYDRFRKGNLSKILEGIQYCLSQGLKEVNALHTICSQTIDNITDCINLNSFVPFSTILFTPYLITHNQGHNTVSAIPLTEIISRLCSNETFNNTEGTLLLIDNYHIEQDGISVVDLHTALDVVKCKNKYRVIDEDPICYGILRVTYDGLILSPRQSLHTAFYNTAPSVFQQNNLNLAFRELRNLEIKPNGD